MKNVLLFALFCFVLFVIVNALSGYTAPTQDAGNAAAAAGSFKTFLSVFGL